MSFQVPYARVLGSVLFPSHLRCHWCLAKPHPALAAVVVQHRDQEEDRCEEAKIRRGICERRHVSVFKHFGLRYHTQSKHSQVLEDYAFLPGGLCKFWGRAGCSVQPIRMVVESLDWSR